MSANGVYEDLANEYAVRGIKLNNDINNDDDDDDNNNNNNKFRPNRPLSQFSIYFVEPFLFYPRPLEIRRSHPICTQTTQSTYLCRV
jgi:hypothetical protein